MESLMAETAIRGVVLVVEDEALVRMVAVDILEESGLSVREAADADEAIAVLASDARIDLLFTDLRMPGHDGVWLAAQALRQRPGLPILFATGYAEFSQRSEDHPILSKPYRAETLLRTVQQLLAQAATAGSGPA
jgi:CheY-like chemotaxis protein